MVFDQYEHIGDHPFVGKEQHVSFAGPRRVNSIEGTTVDTEGNTAASAKAKHSESDLAGRHWLFVGMI